MRTAETIKTKKTILLTLLRVEPKFLRIKYELFFSGFLAIAKNKPLITRNAKPTHKAKRICVRRPFPS